MNPDPKATPPARPPLVRRVDTAEDQPIERVGFIETISSGAVSFNSSGFQCTPLAGQKEPRDGAAELREFGVMLTMRNSKQRLFVPWGNIRYVLFQRPAPVAPVDAA